MDYYQIPYQAPMGCGILPQGGLVHDYGRGRPTSLRLACVDRSIAAARAKATELDEQGHLQPWAEAFRKLAWCCEHGVTSPGRPTGSSGPYVPYAYLDQCEAALAMRQQPMRAATASGRRPMTASSGFGQSPVFDPDYTPQWGEACPEGYQGVPPYCWLTDPSTGLPTYPGGPGAPVEPAPAPVPAPTPAPPPGGAPPAQAAPELGWWQSLSGIEKVGLVGGAAVAAFLLVSLVREKPARFAPNLAAAIKRSPTGVPLVRGKRWGHASAPKKYRRLGATKPSQYAYPKRFMYPLHDKTHVSAAKSRFTKHKRSYPAPIRTMIARNINKAARRHGLDADVKP